MKKEEAKDAQLFILRLIGDHLEQMAVHELKINYANSKTSIDLWNYYKSWNEELEQLYKQNSFCIKNGEYDKVETPERQEPPKF